MPVDQILTLLIAERNKLNRAIEALQGSAKRRGRPAKNPLAAIVTPAAAPVAKKRKRQSAARRKAQAERMKAYWCSEAEEGEVERSQRFFFNLSANSLNSLPPEGREGADQV